MNIELPHDPELIASLLLAATIKSALLLTLVGLLALALKRAAAATRHFLWFAAMAAILLLPLFSILPAWKAPAWAVPAADGIEKLNQVAISVTSGSLQATLPGHENSTKPTALPLAAGAGLMIPAASTTHIGWPGILLIVWAAGAIAHRAWWLGGLLLLRRIAKAARPSGNAQWEELVRRISRELGLRSCVRLLVATGPVMPMTWGWREPVVLLPTEANTWPAERLELVLHHELAHIRRRDYLTQSIAGLACALQWFNPLAWYAARRMRAERELACDDLVLSAGAQPSAYAGHLLEIALRFQNRATVASLPMARKGELEQRLRAVVSENQNHGRLSRAAALTIAAMTFAFVCLVGSGATAAARKSSSETNTIPPRIKVFFADREKVARALEARPWEQNENDKLPTNAWTIFSAGEQGDWSAMTNAYSALRAQRDAGIRSAHGAAFHPIMEAFGAYEQFNLAGEKYSEKFTRDVMDSLPAQSVYFGGTDAGRFLITAAARSQTNGDPCFVVTQNALAGGTYLNYLGFVYQDKLYTPSPEDSQRCFQEYMQGAQRRLDEGKLMAGENVKREDGRITVSGVVAVMQINGLLAKVMFDKNPSREFYIEESFPLDWMYPHLSPDGLILKLNRHPLPGLDSKTIQRDQQYWTTQCKGMIGGWLRPETSVTEACGFATKVFAQGNLSGFKGDPEFVRNQYACMPFAKARAAIAGVYQWRMEHAADASEKVRMADAADFAYRQAFALCPYSPEAASRYARFLMLRDRPADARLVAKTAVASKPEGETGKALQKALDEVEGIK